MDFITQKKQMHSSARLLHHIHDVAEQIIISRVEHRLP